MNDKPTWKVTHLDDIERLGRDTPSKRRSVDSAPYAMTRGSRTLS